ncbi:TonB-dependent receptor [Porticoccaceae bacterium]|nr:TonB-dependent receptor [Porticoccaceae bacterium]
MNCVTGRDNTEKHQAPSKQWLNQLLLITLISLPLPGNASGQGSHQAALIPQAMPAVAFNIPRQAADDSLPVFGQQADVNVIYPFNWVKDHQTNALQGVYSLPQAVAVLLADTGLHGSFSAEGYLVITQVDQSKGKSMNINKTHRKTLLAGLVGLFAAGGSVTAVAQDEVAKEQSRIDEIIVTATKRSQSLQDTPMSISALSGDTIAKQGLVGMGDYLATMPGVAQADYGVGRNRVSMRGVVGSALEESTVSSYFGEVPLNQIDIGGTTVDIKLVDIERVEVLRGPQGTLYGSGSMGGTIRNIPNAPKLDEFELTLEAGLSSTKGASGLNNKTTAVANIPLIDNQLAVRAVAYRFENQGYIDLVSSSDPDKVADAVASGSILSDAKGEAGTEYTGGRLSVLWQPTDELAVTLMHLTQKLEQDGFNDVSTAKGTYESMAFSLNGHLGGSEFLGDQIDITNLVVEYDLGWGSLLSTSTISKSTVDRVRDISRFGTPGLAQGAAATTDDMFQEIRIATELDGPLQFVSGLYYENRQNLLNQDTIWIGDDALMPNGFGPDPDDLQHLFLENHVQQTAFFGELSYQLSDQLNITLGGRRFDYDRRLIDARTGHFARPTKDDASNETGDSKKVNIAYTPNDDTLLYAQWSQGFRLGRPLPPIIAEFCDVDGDGLLDGTPARIEGDSLDADSLDSYELGGKFDLMDNRLAVSAALYHIEWENLPITVNADTPTCVAQGLINGGDASVQGVEIEANYAVSEALRVDIGASYNEGELSEDNSLGSKGDRLPLSPRANANMGIEYSFQLAGYNSFIRADYAYVGAYYNDVKETSLQMGDYDKLSLRAGINIDNWDVEFYGSNLTNSDEITTLVFGNDRRATRLAPAQFGFNARYQF